MTESFNPFEKKYKKVENLPEEHKGIFVDSENGFIKREVYLQSYVIKK